MVITEEKAGVGWGWGLKGRKKGSKQKDRRAKRERKIE